MVEENQTEDLVSSRIPNFTDDTRWSQDGVTVAGSKRWGTSLAHLNFPSGIYVDDEETVFIADYSNNRVVKWKSGATTGEIVIGEGAQEDRSDRLRHPKDLIFHKASNSFIIADEGNRRVARWALTNDSGIQTIISDVDPSSLALDDEGFLYVCDFEKHDVKRYTIGENTGTIVAGGKGKGARLNQLSHPTFIFVDKDQAVYVSDWGNHRVVKWEKGAKRGIFIAGVHAYYTDPKSLADPFGLVVDQSGTVYVADWGKHRVVRWHPGAPEGTVIVGEGVMGNAPNQFHHPMSIVFDRHGNLYVSDYSNQRVQKFNILQNEITE
jgi:sugar lactone lactonase YvrE